MLLMKDHLCSVLLSAWLLVLFLLVLVYVAGSWSKSLRRIFWMICFCDNRVMAKRTTLLTIVFRVIMKSILRPSEGRLLRCFTHMIGLMLSSVALLGYSVLCHLACMAHHVLAKVFWLLALFPSSLLLSCISGCILIALRSVGFVSLLRYGFCFSRCSLRVLLSCLFLCSCALDVSTPTYSRACSALGSPSLFTWSVMHTLCSHLLDKLPLWSFYLCF